MDTNDNLRLELLILFDRQIGRFVELLEDLLLVSGRGDVWDARLLGACRSHALEASLARESATTTLS